MRNTDLGAAADAKRDRRAPRDLWAIYGDIRGFNRIEDAILNGAADIVRLEKPEIEHVHEAMRSSANLPTMLLERTSLPFSGAASCIDDVQDLAFWVNAKVGRCNESLLNASRLISDKESLYRLLEAQGISMPRRIIARDLEDLKRVLSELDRPLVEHIIKPVVGTESRAVYRPRVGDTPSDVISFLENLPDLDRFEPLLVMPYISVRGATREFCLDGIISDQTATFCALHEKTRVFEHYPIHDRTMVTPPRDEIAQEAIDGLLSRFAKAFPLKSFVFHLEARLNDASQLVPIDLSLRPGGGLIFRSIIESCGIDLRMAHIYCSLGLEQELRRVGLHAKRSSVHTAIAATFCRDQSPAAIRSKMVRLMEEADETGGLITYDLSNVSILSAASQSIKPNVGLCVRSTISCADALAKLDKIVERASMSWNSDLETAGTCGGASRATQTLEDSTSRRIPVASHDGVHEASVHARFSAIARERPDAVALVQGHTRMTFRDLETQSTVLAEYLIDQGACRETPIGIHLDRSPAFVVAVLAVLKAGACYIPLDVGFPQARLDRIAGNSKLRIVIASSKTRGRLAAWNATAVHIDELDLCESRGARSGEFDVVVRPQNLACVLYTSGSTGEAKGVAVTHMAILNLVVGQSYIDFASVRCVLQAAPLSFDASTFELWGALLHGGTCVLLDEAVPTVDALRHAIEKEGVDTAWFTASVFNTIVDDAPDILARLKQVVTGGEVVSPRHVMRARELAPRTVVVNGYGPTEATTFACCYTCGGGLMQSQSVPIGVPINNVEMLVLDEDLGPVAPGRVGELFVGGVGLARGYMNQPELTAARFVPHPSADKPGERLYRTGDRARIMPDGSIDFIGRIDRQVKLRGYRIELDEVELAIRRIPDVREVVASVVGEAERRILTARIVLAPHVKKSFDAAGFRAALCEFLPEFMIPTRIEVFDELAKTSGGKLDRAQLAQQAVSLPVERVEGTRIEKDMIAIWEEVLGVSDVRVGDDFFDRGGHSLSATRVLTRIRSRFGVDMGLREIFEHSLLRDLVQRVEALTSDNGAAARQRSVELSAGASLGANRHDRQKALLARKLNDLSDTEIARLLEEKRRTGRRPTQ